MKEWPKGGPPLLWHISDIGDGYGTPAIAGGRIYLISNRGMENEYVQALSVTDGKPVWTVRLGNVGNPDQQPPYPMARSTPMVDGELLYAFSSDGDLACIQTATGKVVWQKNVRREFGGMPGTWAYAESPLIDGDGSGDNSGRYRRDVTQAQQKDRVRHLEIRGAGRGSLCLFLSIAIEAAGRKQYVQFLERVLSVSTRIRENSCGAIPKRVEARRTSPHL